MQVIDDFILNIMRGEGPGNQLEKKVHKILKTL